MARLGVYKPPNKSPTSCGQPKQCLLDKQPYKPLILSTPPPRQIPCHIHSPSHILDQTQNNHTKKVKFMLESQEMK